MEFRRLLLATGALAIVSALLAIASVAGAAARHSALHARLRSVKPGEPVLRLRFGAHALPLLVPHPQAYAAAKAATQRNYKTWALQHPSSTSGAGPHSSTSETAATHTAQGLMTAPTPRATLFEALNAPGVPSGEADTGATPPDTTGAIGPNDYVEFVNSQIAVFDRSNLSLVSKKSEDEFTGSSETCDGQIRWDQQAERWEYASLDCNTEAAVQGFSFGWSKTANPTNLRAEAWCRYHVETGKLLFDYPKLGGDDDFLMIGGNLYEFPEGTYKESGFISISKPTQGSTSCPSAGELGFYEEFPTPFTPVPASTYGRSTTGYIVTSEYSEAGAAKNLFLYKITKGANGEALAQRSTLPVGSYYIPPAVPQPGTTDGLDSSDTRLTQAVATEDPTRHEMTVWTQHTVSASPATPSVVRWYQLRGGTATIAQEGSVEGSAGNFTFNGAISPTARGNGAVVNFNEGGLTLMAQLRVESRAPATPVNQMEGNVLLAESQEVDKDFSCPSPKTPYSGETCRWGDYAGASPDPLHPGVVWGTGEVNGPQVEKYGAQWQTENFALTLHAPPGAGFTVTTPAPTGGAPVEFSGFSGEDPVEPVVSYEWSFGDGANGNGRTPSHVYARPGEYTVKLTVMDEGGVTSTAEHHLVVADTPPAAAFSVTSSSPTAMFPVSFDGSTSHDPDGTIASYAWSFGDGASATGATPSHIYAAPGQYTVTLTVTDDGGKSTSISHAVTVADAAPTASLGVTTSAPTAGIPVAFDGSGSKDPDGSIVSYAWSFGDGSGGGGPQSSHVYTKTGTYTVKLTVTDNGGVTAGAERIMAVRAPSNVFQVLSVKPNKKDGSALVTVSVPGPGTLSAKDASGAHASVFSLIASALADWRAPIAHSAKSRRHKRKKSIALVKAVSTSASGAAILTLKLLPTSAAQKQLSRKHKLSVKVALTFAPTDGTPGTKTQSIVLQKAKRRRRHK